MLQVFQNSNAATQKAKDFRISTLHWELVVSGKIHSYDNQSPAPSKLDPEVA
jgi:hypothetical protein